MSSTPAAEVARYTLPAQLLHWLIALLIFGLFPLGLYMHGLPLSVRKIELYSWHKWFGITVLLLVVLRIGWRLTHRPPPLPGAGASARTGARHAERHPGRLGCRAYCCGSQAPVHRSRRRAAAHAAARSPLTAFATGLSHKVKVRVEIEGVRTSS